MRWERGVNGQPPRWTGELIEQKVPACYDSFAAI